MICPVCKKEISRPLHITKSKDTNHQDFVEQQKQLAVQLLKSGVPLTDIIDDDRIVIKSCINDYLHINYREEMKVINRKTRNERISKSKYVDGGLRKRRQDELEELIENGVEGVDYVICRICGLSSTDISTHVTRTHKISAKEYRQIYPGLYLSCENLRNKKKKNMEEHNPNDNPKSIEKMKKTKANTKTIRIQKAKLQFANGERKVSNNIGNGLNGIRPDLGHNCRSMWEANVARVLKLKGIQYQFEVKTFPFYENGELIDSYLPDFYLPKYNKVIEVKGQMDKVSQHKLNLFRKHYPEIKVIVIEDKQYDWLTKRYKDIIGKKWERSGRNIKTHPQLF